MKNNRPQDDWQGQAERDGRSRERTTEAGDGRLLALLHRRQFLEAAGFSMSIAALSGCGRAPVETAHPLVEQPEGLVPGRTQHYASTCAGCPAGCGLLVGVRDGRPLKMEGMPEHPLSHGGLCAIGQALPLGLYDSHRLAHPLADGKESSWDVVDREINASLAQHAQQGTIAVVTATVTSPTLQATIDKFLQQFPNARHVPFDAVSSSAILDSHQQTHGARLLPRYRFDKASVIVSFGADFLGTWISPVEFTAAWRSNRVPTPDHPSMSYHVQLEGRMSLTGSKADRRFQLPAEEFGATLSRIAIDIGRLAGLAPPEGTAPSTGILSDSDEEELIERLWQARGASLIVSDSQDIAVQALVNYVNHALGNYGTTVDIQNPSRQRQGNDAEVATLVDDIEAGKITALLVAGTDLTHNLPGQESLRSAVAKIPLVVSCADRVDDFASQAHYVCPDHHPLESWLDAEPVEGIVSVSQPTLRPLGNTRSLVESFNRWTGGNESAYDIMQTTWKEKIHPRATSSQPFQAFWDKSVHDGFVEVPSVSEQREFQIGAVRSMSSGLSEAGLSLVLYSKVALTDSRHAQNPWLQELPDPITKVTWDNYVCVSSALASEADVQDGDMVRVESQNGVSIELPAFVQPGQHDRLVAIALGYGVRGTDRFTDIGPQWLEARPTVPKGELVGKNAAGFLEFREDCLQYSGQAVTLQKVRGRRELASTQRHHSMEIPRNVAPHGGEVRDIVQATTLDAFSKDPTSGTPEVHHHSGDAALARRSS